MEWLQALPYAGVGAVVLSILQAVRMLRNDNTAKARRAVGDLERWREDALADAAWYLDLADYWRGRCATREYELRSAGVTMSEPDPLPQRPPPRIREV